MANAVDESWNPGSFTKNFSWGKDHGLVELYENIRLGFDGKLEDVPREEYRRRVANAGRPPFIPINFFLFNRRVNGRNHIIVDELVFQALTSPHSARFDKLALFAFNFSYAGHWKGSQSYQRRPALWAFHYITDRVAKDFEWDTTRISALDIANFVQKSPKYNGETAGKLSTNLSFLYKTGSLSGFSTRRIERWWVDALFLAIDRLIADRKLDGELTPPDMLPGLLLHSMFQELTGPVTSEKTFAMAHLMSLYIICDGVGRFSAENTRQRMSVILPDYNWHEPNDDRPQGAVHPTNPRILKSIPRICSNLAEAAGFQVIDADEMAIFDPTTFIQTQLRSATASLLQDGVKPLLSADELYQLTRGR